MYFINFSFTISHEKNVRVIGMKQADLQCTSKATSIVPRKQLKKVIDRWKKVVTRTFCSQPASWSTYYQYETSELVVQTLLINSNY